MELIRKILHVNRELFRSRGRGGFSEDLGEELLPTLLGSLNTKNGQIYDRLLAIMETLIQHHIGVAVEMVEILMVEFFQIHQNGGEGDEKMPLPPPPQLHPSLLPFRNKLRAVQFIRSIVLADAGSLLSFFLNYDCQSRFAPVVNICIKLLLTLLRHSWHLTPDGEAMPPASSATTSSSPSPKVSSWDVQIRIAVTDALIAFLGTLAKAVDEEKSVIPCCQDGAVNEFLQAQAYRDSTQAAVEAFNRDPREGLRVASEHDLLSSPTLTAARWIRFTRGINKRAAGHLLGAPDQLETLRAFADTFDFAGLSFVASLRQFLEAFRLPGESQVVERSMEEFSRRYHSFASGKLPDQDSIFQLAYSTLMLNTDMHSTSIRVKMTREDFFRNTRRVVSEEKVSDAELETIYEEIKEKEIQLETDTVRHPLPLGSQGPCHWQGMGGGKESDGNNVPIAVSLVSAILRATGGGWSLAMAAVLDEYMRWPLLNDGDRSFGDHDDLLGILLSRLSDYVRLACSFKLEHELQEALGKILTSTIFSRRPLANATQTLANPSQDALNWLRDVCEERGSVLGSAWKPILECLSNYYYSDVPVGKSSSAAPLASPVPASVDLSKLDGMGLLSFFTALLSLDGARHGVFIRHYLGLLSRCPASQAERLLRISYEPVGASGVHSLLALISRSSSLFAIPDAAPLAFAFVQLIVSEHMPLLLYSLPVEGLLDLLRALEAFGLASDVALAQEAIDGFLTVGELLLAQHGGPDGKNGTRRVDDEQFFLRWYHELSGLGRVAMEQADSVAAAAAMEALLHLLREQGALYQVGAWRVIWRSILFPLMEEVRGRAMSQHVHLLKASCDLLSQFEWSGEVFAFLLKHIESLAGEDDVNLFEQALECLGQLVRRNHRGHFIEGNCWDLIMESLGRIYRGILPEDTEPVNGGAKGGAIELHPSQREDDDSSTSMEPNLAIANVQLTSEEGSKSTLGIASTPIELPVSEASRVARKCALQILFLGLLQSLTQDEQAIGGGNDGEGEDEERESLPPPVLSQTSIFSTMSFGHLLTILDMLDSSYNFALRFNGDLVRRQTMVKAGIASSLEMAVLNKQETSSLNILLSILHRLYQASLLLMGASRTLPACLKADGQGVEHAIAVASRYHATSLAACKHYLSMRQQPGIVRRPSKSWAELMQTIFQQWQMLLELQDRSKSKVLAHSPSRQLLSLPSKQTPPSPSSSPTASAQGRALWTIGERVVEEHYEVALEVMLAADRPAVQAAAQSYITYSHTRLARLHLARL